MASSALKIKDLGGELFQLPSNRLKAFLITAIGSWLLFPGTIFAGRAGLLDAATTEIVLVYSNFAAKVHQLNAHHCQLCNRYHADVELGCTKGPSWLLYSMNY